MLVWAEWFESADRRIRITQIKRGDRLGPYVSTVFLGIDHNRFAMSADDPPILYETMVFTESIDGQVAVPSLDMDRCSTWSEAIEMHENMVAKWGEKWFEKNG